MIQSMTGFGRAETEFEGKKIGIEIKSLNSKQADIFTHVPSFYKEKDLDIRNMLLVLQRGKIDLSLIIDSAEAAAPATINAAVFENYKNQIKAIAESVDVDEPTDYFTLLLRLPEVMRSEQTQLSEDEWEAVQGCIQAAIDKLTAFRKHEGEGLEKFFTQRLDIIQHLLENEVPQYESVRVDKIKSRLMDSLKEMESKVSYDENRLEQELIFYIEKLDISEEKQRLAKHIAYFRSTMKDEEGQGKKLGFIAQEMGREINTLGSKANNADLQIVVVKMKDELEKIKEQVLNVL